MNNQVKPVQYEFSPKLLWAAGSFTLIGSLTFLYYYRARLKRAQLKSDPTNTFNINITPPINDETSSNNNNNNSHFNNSNTIQSFPPRHVRTNSLLVFDSSQYSPNTGGVGGGGYRRLSGGSNSNSGANGIGAGPGSGPAGGGGHHSRRNSTTISEHREYYNNNNNLHDVSLRPNFIVALREVFEAVDTDKDNLISNKHFTLFIESLQLKSDSVHSLLSVVCNNNNNNKNKLDEGVGGVLSLSSDESLFDFSTFLGRFQNVLRSENNNGYSSGVRLNVFLGGSCGSTSWRTRIAEPLFAAFNISAYNPQVSNWNSHLVCIENLMKQWCETQLFVIGRKTRSIASMLETAALIAEGRNAVIVIQNVDKSTPVDGAILTDGEISDLNRGRYYLRDMCLTRNIPVFDNVRQACQHVVDYYSNLNSQL